MYSRVFSYRIYRFNSICIPQPEQYCIYMHSVAYGIRGKAFTQESIPEILPFKKRSSNVWACVSSLFRLERFYNATKFHPSGIKCKLELMLIITQPIIIFVNKSSSTGVAQREREGTTEFITRRTYGTRHREQYYTVICHSKTTQTKNKL